MKNHYILTITNELGCAKRGTEPREVLSRYFDGTEAQAKKYFLKQPAVKKYLKHDGYLVSFRANPVTLADNREYKRDY